MLQFWANHRRLCILGTTFMLLFATIVIMFVVIPTRAAYAAGAFSWSIPDDNQHLSGYVAGNPNPNDPSSGQQHIQNLADITPAFYKEGSTIYEVLTDGGNALSSSTNKDVHVCSGTSIDSLSCTDYSLFGDSGWSAANGAHPWLSGGWIDTTTTPVTWYATVHIEFDQSQFSAFNPTKTSPYFHQLRKIGIAKSTDHGATWTYLSDVITSNQSSDLTDFASLRYYNYGDGDQRLFIDTAHSYAYIFYTTGWVDMNTSQKFETVRVARCDLTYNSPRMGAGCWKKFYNGTWTESGQGGKDSDVFPGMESPVVVYNSTLGKFVAISHGANHNATPASSQSWVSMATDLSTQNWQYVDTSDSSVMEYFQSSGTDTFSWYNWAYDTSAKDPYNVGTSFRLYSACNMACGTIVSDAQTKYMDVSLSSSAGTSAGSIPSYQWYPYQSVPDFNPGWQRDANFNARTSPYTLSSGSQNNQDDDFRAAGSRMSTLLSQGSTSTLTTNATYVQGVTANQASPWAHGELWIQDTRFSSVADAEIDANVDPVSGAYFSLIARETAASDGNYMMLDYENGAWKIKYTWGDGPNVSLFSYTLSANTWHQISWVFRGLYMEVSIDNQQQYAGWIPQPGSGTQIPNAAGNIGYRIDDNSTVNFDHFTVWSLPGSTTNLIRNPGFENDANIPDMWETFPYYQQYTTGQTVATNGYAVDICYNEGSPNPDATHHLCNDSTQEHSGTNALRLNATTTSQSVEQIIAVKPHTTYSLTGYFHADSSNKIYLGVKQYGGQEANTYTTAATYTQLTVTFTTGQNANSARIYIWMPSGNYGYADDLSLTENAGSEIVSGASTLTGSYSPADITAQGTSDWIIWGTSSTTSTVVRKSTGGSQISTYTASGSVSQSGGGGFTTRWSDGNSPTSGSSVYGIYQGGASSTLSFTAPADTTYRLLQVYAYVWTSGGSGNSAQISLNAHLSDDSSSVYDYNNADVQVNSGNSGNQDGVYSIWYKAASASQTITLTLKDTGTGTGGVILQAATLQSAPSTSSGILTATYTATSNSTLFNFTTPTASVDWVYWGISSGTDSSRKNLADTNANKKVGMWTNVNVDLSAYSLSGGGGQKISWSDGTPTTSATNAQKGIYVGGAITNGYSLTLPVTSTQVTYKIYVYTWQSQGRLMARLTDASGSQFQGFDCTGGVSANGVGYYTITAQSNTPTMLELTWEKWVDRSDTLSSGSYIAASGAGVILQAVQAP